LQWDLAGLKRPRPLPCLKSQKSVIPRPPAGSERSGRGHHMIPRIPHAYHTAWDSRLLSARHSPVESQASRNRNCNHWATRHGLIAPRPRVVTSPGLTANSKVYQSRPLRRPHLGPRFGPLVPGRMSSASRHLQVMKPFFRLLRTGCAQVLVIRLHPHAPWRPGVLA
jgi:hypothetical protein